MAYKVIILYQIYMPSYFLGTFTEYPFISADFKSVGEFRFHIDTSPEFICYAAAV